MMDYRDQRRAYRRQMRYQRRGYYGGIGGGVWLVVLILIFASSHWIWSILPFLIIPFFFMVIRPRLFGSRNNMNQQQPYNQQQYNQQPYNQPYQPDQPIYQPPVQEDQPHYQSYTQGYKPQATPAQPVENYQEAGQQYQYPPEQTSQQQYEEPLTMYPQE